MTMSEEHKAKLAEGRRKWQEQQKEEKERLKAAAEAGGAQNGEKMVKKGVLKRSLASVTSISGEKSEDLDEITLLEQAESNLEASESLVRSAKSLLSVVRSRRTEK